MSDTFLRLSITFLERDPSGKSLYVSITVRAAAGEFGGQSECVVLGHDLQSFLSDLNALAATSHGEAQLLGGWSDSEYVRLEFSPHGPLGHIAARVRLRDHDPISDLRFEGCFITEPQPLARFCEQVGTALRSERRGDFELYVLGASAA
jgi:hypothetical protein